MNLLPESYSGLVTALEGKDEVNLIIECVTEKILDEYQRRIESDELNEKDSEMALKSSVAVTSTSSKNQGTRHNKGKKEKRINKKDSKETRTCFVCNKPGHLKADYFHHKKLQKNASAESGKSSETAKIGIQKDHVTFNVREKDRARLT